jgi:hypothetical protein
MNATCINDVVNGIQYLISNLYSNNIYNLTGACNITNLDPDYLNYITDNNGNPYPLYATMI